MSDTATIAAFDFDGTLTTCDSLVPFLIYCFGPWKTLLGLSRELPTMIAYLFSWRTRQYTKEKILQRFFKGMTYQELRHLGRKFAANNLQMWLKASSMEKFQWHRNQGHRCILVSASIHIYLEPWASLEGFHDVLTSRLAFDKDGKATGKLVGLNCWGEEKTRRLLELLGERKSFVLYAYGDSKGDEELLKMADNPFKI